MIDIHTHILPRLDDGAKDGAQAKAILQKEQEQGVTTIVFTPHYYGRKHTPQRFLDRRNEAFEQLKPRLDDRLCVRLGAEVHFKGVNVPEYGELCKLAIEGTRYILLEFPFVQKWPVELMDTLANFIEETDFVPIVAHIERYPEVLKDPSLVTELVNMGCLIQVNTSAFLNKREKSFAFALLKRGLVHCIGSDSHDTELRAPNWTEAKQAVETAGFAAEWENAQENMRRILNNEEVVFNLDAPPIKKFFGKYR